MPVASAAAPVGACKFDIATLAFANALVDRARCLLRKINKWGEDRTHHLRKAGCGLRYPVPSGVQDVASDRHLLEPAAFQRYLAPAWTVDWMVYAKRSFAGSDQVPSMSALYPSRRHLQQSLGVRGRWQGSLPLEGLVEISPMTPLADRIIDRCHSLYETPTIRIFWLPEKLCFGHVCIGD
jgi:hypothetical protein